jgi:signal transduction histidine kinase
VAGAGVTVALGGVLRLLTPGIIDPWWVRLSIAGLTLLLAAGIRAGWPSAMMTAGLRGMAGLLILWVCALLWLNDCPPGVSSTAILVQTFAVILFPTAREALAYTALFLTGLGITAAFSAEPVVPLGLAGTVLVNGLLMSFAVHRRARLTQALVASRRGLEDTVAARTAELEREVVERRLAERRAIEASQAKSRFLANMSHELRTPLNAILGYVDLVDEELEESEPAELRQDLAVARAAGHRLLDLVDDVLDLARIEADTLQLVLEPTDLVTLVDAALDEVRPSAEARGLSLARRGTTGPWTTDARRVRQIVGNLLSNAIKFTDTGGVEVVLSEDEVVRIAVRDTGRGISSEQLPRLFERFTRVDESATRATEGTGIGLALSRDLAHRLGGELVAESRVGSGSTFTLVLGRPGIAAATK